MKQRYNILNIGIFSKGRGVIYGCKKENQIYVSVLWI